MNPLLATLEHFVDDLTSVEAALLADQTVVVYTHVDLEGDSRQWLDGQIIKQQPQLIDLQCCQLSVASDCRAALLQLSTTLIRSLTPL